MKPSDFHTVPRSEAGIIIPLFTAAGEDSGEWLRVVGPDSRAYVRAHQRMLRRYAELGDSAGVDREMLAVAILIEFRAALVLDWSFNEPCTPEAVTEFLANAPRVGNQLDVVINDVGRFFGPGSPSSTSGRKSSANSEAEAATQSNDDSELRAHDAPANSSTSSLSGGNSDRAA